jgi:hypothetical protein
VAENPAGEGSPETQASPQATSQPPPVVIYNPPPPASNTLKIILIVVAVFVVLAILAVGAIGFFAWRISRAVHVNQTTGETTITTPGGTFSANTTEKFTAADLGIDVYPGAQPAKGGMRMTLPTGPVIAANYLTSDSKDQVVAFYKSKLGGQATSMEFGSNAIMTLKKSNQEQVTVTIAQQAGQFDGKTQIHIMHTTNSQAK